MHVPAPDAPSVMAEPVRSILASPLPTMMRREDSSPLGGTRREIRRRPTMPADGHRHVPQVGSQVEAPIQSHGGDRRRLSSSEPILRPAMVANRDRQRASVGSCSCSGRVHHRRGARAHRGEPPNTRADLETLSKWEIIHPRQDGDEPEDGEQKANGWGQHAHTVDGLQLRMHRQILSVRHLHAADTVPACARCVPFPSA